MVPSARCYFSKGQFSIKELNWESKCCFCYCNETIKLNHLFFDWQHAKIIWRIVYIATGPTTESYNSPGWQLTFVPVFQPGLRTRDYCVGPFYPGRYMQSGPMWFFTKKKISLSARADQLIYACKPISPIPNISPKLQS